VAFAAALWPKIPVRIAHINPQMPRTPGDPGIPFSELTGWLEGEQPLRGQEQASADLVSDAIGRQIADLVPDGATIQAGLGKVPDAALRALREHRGLRLHTGLIGDGALDLIRSGAMDSGASAIVGVAIGSSELYAGLDHEHLQFRPVTVTHDPATLAGINRLVTINSAMEVDLFGQAYAEASTRGFLSGPGGASDYARGSRQSRGGLRIVALPSTAGPISRIVPPGSGSGPVSLSRFDIDIVVTEHGFADLRGKDYHQRAAALIEISAPQNRDDLSREWTAIAKLI
jgi:acyl-CoA hydrolase